MARDISEWLEELGLSKYAEIFAENEIDLEVVPELTEADLRERKRKETKPVPSWIAAGLATPRDCEHTYFAPSIFSPFRRFRGYPAAGWQAWLS